MRHDRRAPERHDSRVPVEFQGAVVVGEGSMLDISLSGARIEQVSQLPARGEGLRLFLHFAASKGWVEVHGEVIRYTETGGFAVRFLELDVETLRILRMALPRIDELSEKPE